MSVPFFPARAIVPALLISKEGPMPPLTLVGRPYRGIVVSLLFTMLLGGCSSFSKDGGFDSVRQVAFDRLGKQTRPVRNEEDAKAIAAMIEPLLAKTLTADNAVQVALLNNPGLQATYAELGIAEADLVQAGRLPNPGFDFKRTRQGGDVISERTLTFSVINLLTLPLAKRLEAQKFEQVKLEVTNEVLKIAAETRKAYFEAVAAQQAVLYAKQVSLASEAGADLAKRMAVAGNWSKLDEARELTFTAEANAGIAKAKQTAVATREQLTRLMGLPGSDPQFKLPARLPDLPARAVNLKNAESYALQNRLDIQAAKQQTAALAASLGLTRTTRFVSALDLGYASDTETGKKTANGYQIDVGIPLFDWGDARVAKAEALYMQSAHRLSEIAIDARSEVRGSYQQYRTAFELAKQYRDTILPLRKRISDENLLRYNGMLISVFELLADSREQVMSVSGYIEALKDYWIAETDLQAALGGNLPNSQTTKGKAP